MLLLVLILVLVAFGLLVVALLTGNVLSAWLSVAVSVAAAVVLIIDWLQRRSAVKAGRAGAEGTSSPAADTPPEDLDPVTEVLPVYTPESDDPAGETVVSEKGYGRPPEGQRTVAMPAVQPSGSAARPSGAEGPSTPSSGSSSPRVTKSAAGEVSGEVSGDSAGSRPDDHADRAGDRTEDHSDAESTVVVDIRKAGIGGSSPGAGAASDESGNRPDAGRGAGEVDRPGARADASPGEPGGRGGAADAGSQAGSTGSTVAGAAGLTGAALAGGLAAAHDRSNDSTVADTQAVSVGRAGGGERSSAERPDESRPDQQRASSASAAQSGGSKPGDTEEADRTGAPEQQLEGRGADPRAAESRSDNGWASAGAAADAGGTRPGSEAPAAGGRVGTGAVGSDAATTEGRPGAQASDARTAGSRPGGTGAPGSDAPAAEGGAGASGSASEGRPESATVTGSGATPEDGRPAAAPGSDAAEDRPGGPAAESRPGAQAEGVSGGEGRPAGTGGPEAPGGERRAGEPWASGAPAGESRPGGAWATGAAAPGAAGAASRSEGAAEPTTDQGASEAREPEPSRAANGADRSEPAAEAGSRPVDPRGAQAPWTEQTTRDDHTARATFGGSAPGSGNDLFEPAPPPAGSADATAVMGVAGSAQQGSAQQAGSHPAGDAEPPEESVDAVLGRVAATVEDEVLVIDEQPRYHLMGCRALMAQQTIPLPAREAVELGFTPCGWCNPAAALSARHPASARP